jgi:hypothetical protein
MFPSSITTSVEPSAEMAIDVIKLKRASFHMPSSVPRVMVVVVSPVYGPNGVVSW